MAIRQRGARFQVDVKVSGQRVRAAADTREEARKLEADIRATLLGGNQWTGAASPSRTPNGATLTDLRDLVWQNYWRHQKAGTGQLANADAVLEILGKDRLVSQVKNGDVDELRERLEARGNSNATINRKLSALSKMMKEAHNREWINRKPLITKTREGQGRIRWLTPEEILELLAWCKFTGFYSHARFFLVALDTGARTGELRRLEVRDVELDAGKVRLWETKNGEARSVPLTERAVAALREEIREGRGPSYLFSLRGCHTAEH